MLNVCCLGLCLIAIGGTWSSTLFSLDCYGHVSFTVHLNCVNTNSNTVYLNDVVTPSHKLMQLFGYGNNIFLCTSNSNSTGYIYFRNKTVSPFPCTYNNFASFSHGSSYSNSSLVLNNALMCTNITCNGKINFSTSSLGTTYTGSRIILWVQRKLC